MANSVESDSEKEKRKKKGIVFVPVLEPRSFSGGATFRFIFVIHK